MKQNNAFHSSSKFILNLIWRPCPKRQGQSIHKKKNTNRQPSSWADLVNRFRVRKAWHFFSCTSRCASSPVEGLGSEDAGKKVDLRSLKTTKRKEVWKAVGNVICCVSIRCVFLFVLCRNKKHQCIMTIKMCTKKWYSKNMITKKGLSEDSDSRNVPSMPGRSWKLKKKRPRGDSSCWAVLNNSPLSEKNSTPLKIDECPPEKKRNHFKRELNHLPSSNHSFFFKGTC